MLYTVIQFTNTIGFKEALTKLTNFEVWLTGKALADVRGRTTLIAKARWLLLLLTSCYVALAAIFFAQSDYGLTLDKLQLTVGGISFCAVLCYNTLYHFYYETILRLKYVDYFQMASGF